MIQSDCLIPEFVVWISRLHCPVLPRAFLLQWSPLGIHSAHMLPKARPAKYSHKETWCSSWEVGQWESQESREYALQKESHNICSLNGLISTHVCGWIWPVWSPVCSPWFTDTEPPLHSPQEAPLAPTDWRTAFIF